MHRGINEENVPTHTQINQEFGNNLKKKKPTISLAASMDGDIRYLITGRRRKKKTGDIHNCY